MRVLSIALASLALLPNFISTQQASYPRSYFSSVVQNNAIYILGGSNTTLDVPVLNITNGLDTNNAQWYFWPAKKAPELIPFTRGVAFQGANNQIFVQAGLNSSTELENMALYNPSSGDFQIAGALGQGPPASFLMTAAINPSSNIAYYYGGETLVNHELNISSIALNTFYKFDTNTKTWSNLNPSYPNAIRPGRTAHTANIVNNQMFIMSGITYGANSTTGAVDADFESVLVYDINNNTAASVTTYGDIPAARQSYSTALGLDGKSIVVFGGYYFDGTNKYNPAPSDSVYILDTCTLQWRKQSVGGTTPTSLFAHGAVNINNYMVVLMGLTDPATYNLHTYILDMSQWKWVNTLSSTTNSIATATCQFPLQNLSPTNFVEFNYDYGVLYNPLTQTSNNKSAESKGLGIGFGLLIVVLIAGGVWFYLRRKRRNNARNLNPRWMRNVPPSNNYSNDRDYPLFVYNKELDNDNTNNPNRPAQSMGVRTYTASDHEQWEQETAANTDSQTTQRRHSDIWKRMRGLNDVEAINEQQNHNPFKDKILDV